MKDIMDSSQKSAYQALKVALVYGNQLIGYRIVKEAFNGENRVKLYCFLKFNKRFRKLSTQCVDNPMFYEIDHIIKFYCKQMIEVLEIAMKKKRLNKLGVYELYKEIYLLYSIIV